MNKYYILCLKLLIIVFFVGCGENQQPVIISLSALISNPGAFNQKEVIVTGYLGRGNDVYLTKEHSDANDRTSSLFLNLELNLREDLGASFCRDRHVEVVGEFGLVQIEGAVSRVGLNKISSIKDQLTRQDCIDLD